MTVLMLTAFVLPCSEKDNNNLVKFYCASRNDHLPPIQKPPQLFDALMNGDHHKPKGFLNNLYESQYNSTFQVIFFGAYQVIEGLFMSTFKIQGLIPVAVCYWSTRNVRKRILFCVCIMIVFKGLTRHIDLTFTIPIILTRREWL